jgi:hypothetical protein
MSIKPVSLSPIFQEVTARPKRKRTRVNDNESTVSESDNTISPPQLNLQRGVIKEGRKRSRVVSDVHAQAEIYGNGCDAKDTTNPVTASHLGGCSWDAENWSCAYDCVFMIMFTIYRSQTPTWKAQWSSWSSLNAQLADSFATLHSGAGIITHNALFDIHRNSFRDSISQLYPTFPRYGAVGSSASAIVDVLTRQSRRHPCIGFRCRRGCNNTTIVLTSPHCLPTMWTTRLWSDLISSLDCTKKSHPQSITVQSWVDLIFRDILAKNGQVIHVIECSQCASTDVLPFVYFNDPPPLLVFEDEPGSHTSLLPSPTVSLPALVHNVTYDLRGVIYLTGYHFTAWLIGAHPSNVQWAYDGQRNQGTPVRIENGVELSAATSHIYVYEQRPLHSLLSQ